MSILQVGVLLNENLLLIKTKTKIPIWLALMWITNLEIFSLLFNIIHDSEMPIIDTEMPNNSLFFLLPCVVFILLGLYVLKIT